MKRIAVIGANGQVGSEVCLFLAEIDGTAPVAICRSDRSAGLLRRFGVECRIGRMDDPATASRVLDGCDLVADFTLPKGRLADIMRTSEALMRGTCQAAPASVPVVYISSYMALGMQGENAQARYHRLPRTAYAVAKRHGERTARRLAARSGHPAFVLRLGQVYGELQAVSQSLLAEVPDTPVLIPDCASYSVFAFTIAEALAHIAAGREQPGTYTLVSEPEWTWREVYEYHCARRGVQPPIDMLPVTTSTGPTSMASAIRRPAAALATAAAAFASRHRELIAANFLWRAAALEGRVQARYRVQRARTEINQLENAAFHKPFLIFAGPVYGRRLSSLSDSRTSMPPVAEQVRARLATIIQPVAGSQPA